MNSPTFTETALTDLLSLITRMMHNPMGERFVRAGLIADGWRAEDVAAALSEMAAQAQVEAPAYTVPQQANIALTGQDRGVSE